MPHANVWIRKSDWDDWKKLPNKSEAISQMLRGQTFDAVKVEEKVEIFDFEQPCCQLSTPCKHWTWESAQEAYINVLSGRVKEV